MDRYALLRHMPFRRFKEPPPRVAVLRLAGVIGGLGRLRRGLNLAVQGPLIERAFKLPRLKAVALAINSPGGSPVQSALIAGRIRALAEEKEVPVVAFAEDLAASGGYWLACAADEIYANESSIVGSIGVVSAGFGFPDLLGRIGIERRVHTAGGRKAMLDPFRAEDPEDVSRLEAIQESVHESFKAHVRKRRGGRLKGDEDPSSRAIFLVLSTLSLHLTSLCLMMLLPVIWPSHLTMALMSAFANESMTSSGGAATLVASVLPFPFTLGSGP